MAIYSKLDLLMLYIGPFKWYLTIFCLRNTTILFIQQSRNESEGDTFLLGSHEQGHRSSLIAECKQAKK